MTEWCCVCCVPLHFEQFEQVNLKGNSQFTECVKSSSSKQAPNFTLYQKNKNICTLEKGEAEFAPLFLLSLTSV